MLFCRPRCASCIVRNYSHSRIEDSLTSLGLVVDAVGSIEERVFDLLMKLAEMNDEVRAVSLVTKVKE